MFAGQHTLIVEDIGFRTHASWLVQNWKRRVSALPWRSSLMLSKPRREVTSDVKYAG